MVPSRHSRWLPPPPGDGERSAGGMRVDVRRRPGAHRSAIPERIGGAAMEARSTNWHGVGVTRTIARVTPVEERGDKATNWASTLASQKCSFLRFDTEATRASQ